MRVQMDLTELRALSRDLQSVGPRTRTAIRPILRDEGRQIRDIARNKIRGFMSGKSAIKHYPRAITSGPSDGSRDVVEIGPEKGKKQGGMGAAIEFGSSKAGPFPHLNPALEERLSPATARMIQAALSRMWR